MEGMGSTFSMPIWQQMVLYNFARGKNYSFLDRTEVCWVKGQVFYIPIINKKILV